MMGLGLPDLEPLHPLWLHVLRVLDRKGELSVNGVVRESMLASDGRYTRIASVSRLLGELDRAGIVNVRIEEGTRRVPAKFHRLSNGGRALLEEAEAFIRKGQK